MSRQSVSLVDTSYTCELLSVAPEQSRGDQDVVITGRAIARASGTPLPLVPLQLVISSGGFERYFQVYTDSLGGFLYAYKPLPTESGVYRVSCIHPDLRERPEQGRFTIGRVIVDPTQINLNLPRNYEQTVPLQVTVGAGAVATQLQLQYLRQDQPDGQLAPGILINLSEPLSLTERQTGTLSFTLRADDAAYQTGTLVLRVVSDESGGTPWALIPVKYFFSEAKPALFVTPSYLELGVAREQSTTGRVTLENRGLAELNEVKLALLDAVGGTPPSWLFLVSPAEQGTLAIGEKRSIDLTANPTATVAEGIYEVKLRVTASNHPTTDINVYVSVTQSGIGHVLFKLSDIYTATLDKNGQLIQGLAGAKIQLQNEQVLSIDQTLTTDAAGEALFKDLPTGNYKYRASAPNHQSVIGRLKIEPGITVTQPVFLDYTLVTVEWSVNEISLEDRYEIVLKATYETDVPAPVVLLEPMSVNLPKMQPGEVFHGELTLTNYGLVRADDLKLTLPSTDQYFAYEFQANVPKSLAAKQRITIPYRITSLRSIDSNSEGEASGGGCSSYQQCGWEEHCWERANGFRSCGSSPVCWYLQQGQQCGGSIAVPLIGGSGSSSGGSGGGGGIIYTPLLWSFQCDSCSGDPPACPVCNKNSCDLKAGGYTCVVDDTQVPGQSSPMDCKKQICSGGSVTNQPDDTETPPQGPTNDCKKEVCSGGSMTSQPDDTETPHQIPDDCKKEICSGGSVTSQPDDTETPHQIPDDCKKEICSGGSVTSQPDDTEIPTEICKECKNGKTENRPNGSTPSDPDKCCFDGQELPKYNNPYDVLIKKCPNREQIPESRRQHEIDSCTNSPDDLESWDNLPFTTNYDLYVANPIWGTVLGSISNAQAANQTLPCNVHDICYQTCGSDKAACDAALGAGITASCDIGYPHPCPRQNQQECVEYEAEYQSCRDIGPIYADKVRDYGGSAYRDRQVQYCACCQT